MSCKPLVSFSGCLITFYELLCEVLSAVVKLEPNPVSWQTSIWSMVDESMIHILSYTDKNW